MIMPMVPVIPAEGTPSKIEAKIHAPARPRIITESKTPGAGPRIIIMTIPGPVIPTGAIHDRRPVNITAHIPRRIPYINILRCRFIDINILHIVDRARRRNIIYLARPGGGHPPGTIRTR
jgi:hypothetical protein